MNRTKFSRRRVLAGLACQTLLWPPGLRAQVPASTRPIESFASSSELEQNCAPALAEAGRWSAETGGTVSFAGRYRIGSCANVSGAARFRFNDARFTVADDGAPGTISNGSRGRIGILFSDGDGLSLTGSATFAGAGVAGRTTLAGIVYDRCRRARVVASFRFETMAAGCFVFWCDDGEFGPIAALDMHGRQTFGEGTAGTALVVVGCRRSSFGAIDSRRNFKPILYCSLAFDGQGRAIGNEQCRFGAVTGTAWPNSPQSSLITLRSARDCTFESLDGSGFAVGYLVDRYDTDARFVVEGNRVGSLTGSFPSTPASVDAAVLQQAESDALPVGANRIDSIDVECGGEFGVAVFSGSLSVGAMTVRGGFRPVTVHSGAIEAESIAIANPGVEAVTVGGAGRLSAGLVDIQTGSVHNAASVIRYHSAFGRGPLISARIDRLRYRRNGAGGDPQYLAFDEVSGPERWQIGAVDGAPRVAHALLGGARAFNVAEGRLLGVR